jgi:hypothetical protein
MRARTICIDNVDIEVRLAAGRLTPNVFASSLTKSTPAPDIMELLSKVDE